VPIYQGVLLARAFEESQRGHLLIYTVDHIKRTVDIGVFKYEIHVQHVGLRRPTYVTYRSEISGF